MNKTKADTLKLLEKENRNFKVLSQFTFTIAELRKNPHLVGSEIQKRWKEKVIVRSSACDEDMKNQSNAGKYMSIPNVEPKDAMDAIEVVADSYNNCAGFSNQILVQPMLQNIVSCGVLFTVDPNTGGNYFVINYDESGSFDTVTSGKTNESKLVYIFKGHKSKDDKLDALCDAAVQIENILDEQFLDIEFAYVKGDDKPFILQARPLVCLQSVADAAMQEKELARVRNLLAREMCEKPYAKGKTTIFGVMSDWNPAEMIGIRPKPLAFSLYRRLITDRNWAYQRDNYGYRNMRSHPLLFDLLGMPYVDIRTSFNSFVPKDLDDELCSKLVNYYIKCLQDKPERHDKIEFEVVFSCYTFDMDARLSLLFEAGFTEKEIKTIKELLRTLTAKIINITDGLWITDGEKIKLLQERQDLILNSNLDIVSKIYWLLEDCGRYGTLPFAGLARAGFIAVSLLKSLVSMGILCEADYGKYMRRLSTVGSQMSADRRNTSKSYFVEKYGHLRPSTYDITSPRYDHAVDLYFGEEWELGHDSDHSDKKAYEEVFALTLEQYQAVKDILIQNQMEDDVLQLFHFIQLGIEYREFSKFIFTKSLSHALELMAELGEQYGFERKEMAFCDIGMIDRLFSSTDDVAEVIAQSIREGKAKYEKTNTYAMPPLIIQPDDIFAFEVPTGLPNFITLGSIVGEIIWRDLSSDTVGGKIVLIDAADPGYDWIFACEITGLITAYGGANSHMAIRAGELGIPAAIGVGEKQFNRLRAATTVRLECAMKVVEVLK